MKLKDKCVLVQKLLKFMRIFFQAMHSLGTFGGLLV